MVQQYTMLQIMTDYFNRKTANAKSAILKFAIKPDGAFAAHKSSIFIQFLSFALYQKLSAF